MIEPRATRRLLALAAVLRWASPRAWFLEDEVAGLAGLVAPGATCVDVGAEYGLYTYAFAALAGPGGRVLAVEPQPGPRRFVAGVLRAVGAATVTLHATALSSSPGTGTMSLPVRRRLPVHGRAFLTSGADGLGPNAEFSAHRDVEVAVGTLDDLVAEHGTGRVDVVKADVEGAELAVLRGARAVLERDRPVLLLEVEDRHLAKYGARAADVVEHLAALGYAPHAWDGRAWHPVDRVAHDRRNYAFVVRDGAPRPPTGRRRR